MINVPYEVKKALRLGNYRKNYKIKVYDNNTYLFTIDNDTLIKESVKIDERMATGKVLEFGLCEGSSLEFEYFNHPNINGKRLEVLLSVQYGDNLWYDIPMGWFDVDQCPMQWDTGIYKVTAFNKLKSEYLDAEAKNEVKALVEAGAFGQTGSITMYMLLERMLEGYRVTPEPEEMILQEFTLTPTNIDGYYVFKTYSSSEPHYYQGFDLYVGSIITSYAFQLNTLQDYYRLILNLESLKAITETFIQDWWVNVGSDNNPIYKTLSDAIAYRDAMGQKGFGNLFYGTIQLVRADDPTQDIFSYRIGDPIDNNIFDDSFDIYDDFANCYKLVYTLPVIASRSNTTPPTPTLAYFTERFNTIYGIFDFGKIYQLIMSDANLISITSSDVENMQNVTIRELQSAVFELDCQYGQLDRETDLFKGVELNQGGLHPADGLYPANGLYPSGQSHIFPSSYQKLWTDTGGEQSFRYLIITYKTTEIVDGHEQEVEKKLQRTVNTNGTTNYNMSDNWLFRNLIWTAEDVGAYADAMVLKMKDITWFPFEMWCTGLPYLETGDALEIVDREGNTHISYILNRQLNGIHNLRDTFINGELDVF